MALVHRKAQNEQPRFGGFVELAVGIARCPGHQRQTWCSVELKALTVRSLPDPASDSDLRMVAVAVPAIGVDGNSTERALFSRYIRGCW